MRRGRGHLETSLGGGVFFLDRQFRREENGTFARIIPRCCSQSRAGFLSVENLICACLSFALMRDTNDEKSNLRSVCRRDAPAGRRGKRYGTCPNLYGPLQLWKQERRPDGPGLAGPFRPGPRWQPV